MDKIASPQDLQGKIREILAYCEKDKPSREVIAKHLRDLAEGVKSGSKSNQEYLAEDADGLVQMSDRMIRKLQLLIRECKGMQELDFDLKHSMKHIVEVDSALRRVHHQLSKSK